MLHKSVIFNINKRANKTNNEQRTTNSTSNSEKECFSVSGHAHNRISFNHNNNKVMIQKYLYTLQRTLTAEDEIYRQEQKAKMRKRTKVCSSVRQKKKRRKHIEKEVVKEF